MRHFLFIPIFVLLLFGCKRNQEIAKDIPPRSADKLVEALQEKAPEFKYYSAKADVSVEMNGQTRSVNTHIRSVHDSVLWVSATPALGIEVARMLLSKDSLKLMDRINDSYFIGSHQDASSRFGVPVEMDLLEGALLGLPIGLDEDQKYRSDRENGQYVLYSKGPRRFLRAAETAVDTTNETAEEREARRIERVMRQAQQKSLVITKYWIDPLTMLTSRVLIADLSNGMQADVIYHEREELNGLPKELEVVVADQQREARIKLELNRIRTTGPLKVLFKIPEKYEPMEP